MSYWYKVLEEVLHQQDPAYPKFFTHLTESFYISEAEPMPCKKSGNYSKPSRRAVSKDSNEKTKHKKASTHKKYALGEKFPSIYLTRREAQLMFYFICGMSTSQVANILNLSPRTIEFYINNMKSKLNCKLKLELIQKVMASDFLNQIDF